MTQVISEQLDLLQVQTMNEIALLRGFTQKYTGWHAMWAQMVTVVAGRSWRKNVAHHLWQPPQMLPLWQR